MDKTLFDSHLLNGRELRHVRGARDWHDLMEKEERLLRLLRVHQGRTMVAGGEQRMMAKVAAKALVDSLWHGVFLQYRRDVAAVINRDFGERGTDLLDGEQRLTWKWIREHPTRDIGNPSKVFMEPPQQFRVMFDVNGEDDKRNRDSNKRPYRNVVRRICAAWHALGQHAPFDREGLLEQGMALFFRLHPVCPHSTRGAFCTMEGARRQYKATGYGPMFLPDGTRVKGWKNVVPGLGRLIPMPEEFSRTVQEWTEWVEDYPNRDRDERQRRQMEVDAVMAERERGETVRVSQRVERERRETVRVSLRGEGEGRLVRGDRPCWELKRQAKDSIDESSQVRQVWSALLMVWVGVRYEDGRHSARK